jgi:hypothetical protein
MIRRTPESLWIALPVTWLLHYLLTPFEASSATVTIVVRAMFGAALALLFVCMAPPGKRDAHRAVGWLSLLFVLLAITNRLQNGLELAMIFTFMIIGFTVAICDSRAARTTSSALARPIQMLAAIWVGALVTQVGIFFLMGSLLDLHAISHPGSSSRLYGVVDLFRFTGFHIEPGTYSNWLFGLILLRGLATNKLFDRVALLAVSSVLLTFSLWGVAAFLTYLTSYLLTHSRNGFRVATRSLGASALVLTLCALIANAQLAEHIPDLIAYFERRSELDDVSGTSKLQVFEAIRSLIWRVSLLGIPVNRDFCGGCSSPQDAGLLVNLAVRAGIPMAVAIFIVIGRALYRRHGTAGLLLLAPLAFAKYFLYEPLFWMIFGYSLIHPVRLTHVRSVPSVPVPGTVQVRTY